MSNLSETARLAVENDIGNESESTFHGTASLHDESSTVGDASLAKSSSTVTRYFDRFGFIHEQYGVVGDDNDGGDEDGDEYVEEDRRSIISHSRTSVFSEGGRRRSDASDLVDEESSRVRKWEALLDQCALTPSGEPPAASLSKVKYRMRLGLPDVLRKRAWTVITGVDAIMAEREGDYQSLVEEANLVMSTSVRLHGRQPRLGSIGEASATGQSVGGVIERDLHRTFPRHVLFCNKAAEPDLHDDFDASAHLLDADLEWPDSPAAEPDTHHDDDAADSSVTASPPDISEPHKQDTAPQILKPNRTLYAQDGHSALRRLLRAYSVYDEVGYCQGMNFIAAMFLTFLPEEESFWLLVAVMNEEPYEMRDLFGEDMAGTHKALFISEKLVKRFLPKLHRHLEREDIHLSMFATQWLMTIFTSTFPFDLVVRVWDSFLVEGWKVVYRVMLALLELAAPDLMNLHFEDILDYLRDKFPSKVRGRSIMNASLKIPLKTSHIQKYTNKWRIMQSRDECRVRQVTLRSDSGDSAESGP